MGASKPATKGDGYNQTHKVAPKTNKHKPMKGKQTRTWQRPRFKQTSIDPNINTSKREKKAQTYIEEPIQTLY